MSKLNRMRKGRRTRKGGAEGRGGGKGRREGGKEGRGRGYGGRGQGTAVGQEEVEKDKETRKSKNYLLKIFAPKTVLPTFVYFVCIRLGLCCVCHIRE